MEGKVMINIRLVSNVIKDGNTFTLVNVKATTENPEALKSASAAKEVNNEFTNVNDLFSAIQQHVVDLVASGLI
jgi:hypothetical protein